MDEDKYRRWAHEYFERYPEVAFRVEMEILDSARQQGLQLEPEQVAQLLEKWGVRIMATADAIWSEFGTDERLLINASDMLNAVNREMIDEVGRQRILADLFQSSALSFNPRPLKRSRNTNKHKQGE
jgi:hypothetical protein